MAWRVITVRVTEDEARGLIERKALPDWAHEDVIKQLEKVEEDRKRDEHRRANLKPYEAICPRCKGIIIRDRGCPMCPP